MKNRVTHQRLVDMGRKALAQEICHRSGGMYDLGVLMSMDEDALRVIYFGLPSETEPLDLGEKEVKVLINREKDESFVHSKHFNPEQ